MKKYFISIVDYGDKPHEITTNLILSCDDNIFEVLDKRFNCHLNILIFVSAYQNNHLNEKMYNIEHQRIRGKWYQYRAVNSKDQFNL